MEGPPSPGSIAGPEMEAQLVACVHESLALYLYENARFMAERLVAEFPREGNQLLLASCYFRSDQAYRAYHLLLGRCSEAGSRYLLAQCCFSLGKYAEAEEALLGPAQPSYLPSGGSTTPGGAAGLYLLGRICRLTQRVTKAVQYLCGALSLNPLLWCAYEELCLLGADAEALQASQAALSHAATAAASATSTAAAAPPQATANGPVTSQPQWTAESTPLTPAPSFTTTGQLLREGPNRGLVDSARGPDFAKAPTKQGGKRPGSAANSADPLGSAWQPHVPQFPSLLPPASAVRPSHQDSLSSLFTPGFPQHDFATPSPVAPPQRNSNAAMAPARQRTIPPPPPHLPPLPPGQSRYPGQQAATGWPAAVQGTPTGERGDSPSTSQRWKFLDEGKLRKVSGRLFSAEPSSSLRRSSKVAPSPMDTSPVADDGCSPSGQPWHEAAVSGLPAGAKSATGKAAVLVLLATLGDGFRLLCMYRCQDAMLAFKRLSHSQYATGWVLCCIGRAFFEMVDYAQSAVAYEWAHQVDPHRLEGMEVYSTVLWHLKREVDLSHLAQMAISLDRRSAHAWAIVGNCFSLQKEHDAALKVFQRSLQLAPHFAYAFTLAAHEYFANEDLERSMQYYQAALRLDGRHYNAWYGIGQIYYRQEKYEMAEFHFRRSLEINERSSVLRCYLGMALAKMGRVREALDMLALAAAADHRNPLARFERARVLMGLDRFEDALLELQALKEQAPKESSVHFHIGRVLKRLGRTSEALMALNAALDLQPTSSDAALIKNALDKLQLPDDSTEEDM